MAELDPSLTVPPNLDVEAALLSAISDSGRITFAEFMDICLYSPGGYYNSGRASIGAVGSGIDFMTSPEAHPSFGATMGSVFHAMWGAMDRPDPFRIVEMGAGNGTFAHDVLSKVDRSYPDLRRSLQYSIVEISPAFMTRQRQLLQDRPVEWLTEESLEDVTGVISSNEFLDVRPVHRLVKLGDEVLEYYVALDNEGKFAEVLGEPSPTAAAVLDSVHLPPGQEITISPEQDSWMRKGAAVLSRGYIVTIDYAVSEGRNGEPALWTPRVYSNQLPKRTGYPIAWAYEHPGTLDITASVDFERLRRIGEAAGLRTILQTDQASFLRAHGLDREVQEIARATRRLGIEAATHYFASHALIDSEYMGDFTVLVQGKNVPAELPQSARRSLVDRP
jgi:SAM-dependent MidA family methyltransferase